MACVLIACQNAILAGCGDYGPDMKAELAGNLSNQWQVRGLQIKEWEIVRREPRQWHYHFTATALPTEDLYKRIGILNNTAVLVPTAQKGEVESLSGTADARFDGKIWRSQFDFDRAAAFFEGAPKTAYGANFVIVGNPSFQAFLASAEIELQKREEKLGNDESLFSQKIGEWNASNNAFKDSVQQIQTDLESEQKQLQQEQLNIGSSVRREVQAASLTLQAEMRERLDGHRKDLDARNATLTQSYRAKMLALQAQLRDMQRLSRDEYSERSRQLREQESAIQKQYREQLDQVRDTYSSRVKATQQEFDARRARLQDDITSNVTANVEKSGAALQEKREQQQGNLQTSQNQLVDQRNKLEQFSSDVQSQKADLAQQRQLLEQLKTQAN
ncbi:hypothetical protein [Cupriavidus basilensis]|uniref:hypothetical protein n=1 Tax=Cupriavidus basilensis TaxID=68895 RepID=UPI0020A62C4E|nr:hypothetical protein [Cupriavidus basilensis]MCP3023987.1 hypothetical protein [Cupriavidus basilensis]